VIILTVDKEEERERREMAKGREGEN